MLYPIVKEFVSFVVISRFFFLLRLYIFPDLEKFPEKSPNRLLFMPRVTFFLKPWKSFKKNRKYLQTFNLNIILTLGIKLY